MRKINSRFTLAISTGLICAGLLTACNDQPPPPATTAVQPTLPVAVEIQPTKVPSPTPIPTATEVIMLVPTPTPVNPAFRRGEPPSLTGLQAELATYAAQYGGVGDKLPTTGPSQPFQSPPPVTVGSAKTPLPFGFTPAAPKASTTRGIAPTSTPSVSPTPYNE